MLNVQYSSTTYFNKSITEVVGDKMYFLKFVLFVNQHTKDADIILIL